jgi:hypothetical protein
MDAMDQEITRFIFVLLLSGLALFAWHYYQAAVSGKPSSSITTAQQEEVVDKQKTGARRAASSGVERGIGDIL